MTKLYHEAGVGWQLPGQQTRGAERVDVPNAPVELASWLDERGVSPRPNELTLADQIAIGTAELQADPQLASTGAVLSAADVARVNDSRPTFLPRLSAEEIEARRMAVGRCPKCNSHAEGEILSFIYQADDEQLRRIAGAIERHTAELLEAGEGSVQ